MIELKCELLTREAFAPFGDVIEASDAVKHFTINAGNTERYHDLADVHVGQMARPSSPFFVVSPARFLLPFP